MEAQKSSYTVEVRRVVLSMLGCIEYHQRSLHRGDVPTLWKCGKGSYTVDVRVVLSMLGCIDYIKDPYRVEAWQSSYTMEVRRVV